MHLSHQEFGSFTLSYNFVSISKDGTEEEIIKEFQTHLWGLWEYLGKYIQEPGMGR